MSVDRALDRLNMAIARHANQKDDERDRYRRSPVNQVAGYQNGAYLIQSDGDILRCQSLTTGSMAGKVARRGDAAIAMPSGRQKRIEVAPVEISKYTAGYVFSREVSGATDYTCPRVPRRPPSDTADPNTSYVMTYLGTFPGVQGPIGSRRDELSQKVEHWLLTGAYKCPMTPNRMANGTNYIPSLPDDLKDDPDFQMLIGPTGNYSAIDTEVDYYDEPSTNGRLWRYSVTYRYEFIDRDGIRWGFQVSAFQTTVLGDDAAPSIPNLYFYQTNPNSPGGVGWQLRFTPEILSMGGNNPYWRVMLGNDSYCLLNPGVPNEDEPPNTSREYWFQPQTGNPTRLDRFTAYEPIDTPDIFFTPNGSPIVVIRHGSAEHDGGQAGLYCRITIYQIKGQEQSTTKRRFRYTESAQVREYLGSLGVRSPLLVKAGEVDRSSPALGLRLLEQGLLSDRLAPLDGRNYTNYSYDLVWVPDFDNADPPWGSKTQDFQMHALGRIVGAASELLNIPKISLLVKGFSPPVADSIVMTEKERGRLILPGLGTNDTIRAIAAVRTK